MYEKKISDTHNSEQKLIEMEKKSQFFVSKESQRQKKCTIHTDTPQEEKKYGKKAPLNPQQQNT